MRHEVPPGEDAPFILMAGERRGYNANQIYRDPAWRKVDAHGAMRMHPRDAEALAVVAGDRVRVANAHGNIDVVIDLDDSVRQGMVQLPHGYGQRYAGGAVVGPELIADHAPVDDLVTLGRAYDVLVAALARDHFGHHLQRHVPRRLQLELLGDLRYASRKMSIWQSATDSTTLA